jgi:hypothetical protein
VQQAAVIAQVAFTIVLVSAASVLVFGLQSLRNAPVAVDLKHVIQLQLAEAPGGYVHDAAPPSYYAALLDRVRALPGVTATGLSADVAFNSQARQTQVRSSEKEGVSVDEQIVTDGFLAAMGIAVVDGRDFSTTDRPLSSVMLSQSLAQRLYGANSAVGRQVQIGTGSRAHTATVVGVAADAVLRDPKERATAVVYENWWGGPMFFPNLVVRTATADPTRVIHDVRAVVEGEHREFVSRVRTLQGTFDASLTQQFLLASLSAAFGSLGLLLAGVGLFGLLAFTVAQRRSEIGVRLAIGASRAHVFRTVVGDSLRMVFVGMALGTPVGWIASRAATTVIGGARVNIAASLVIGGALLTVAAFAATAPPAVRASAIDPLEALRQD